MPAFTSEKLVLVVGAGPTGLTAALALARSGVRVRIIEESARQHDAVRGTAIQPRTRELLAILGAHEDLSAVAMGPLQMAVYGTDGKTPVKVFEWSEAAPQSPTIPFDNLVSIGQSEVERILTRHLQQYGCELELGTRLVGISQDEQGVTAKVLREAVGRAGTEDEEEIKCEYLVAADGAKGRSRKFTGVSFLGETKEVERMWAANVEVPGFSREYWHRWGDFATAATMLKPINTGNQFQIQSFGSNLPPHIPQDLAGMQQLFNSIAKRDDIRFTNVSWSSEWRANIRMTDKFSVGRVFLAGDAAHCHSPAGGQGTNTSMQDAFNLAWKLALVTKGKASPDLLKSYEAERMPVVAEMLNLSNELHAKTLQHTMPDVNSLNSGSAGDDPIRRSSKLLQLGVNYRFSAITQDERDSNKQSSEKNPYGTLGDRVRAGDRAPYIGGLTLQDGRVTDLFALLHDAPSHVVLFFPSATSTSTLESIAGVQNLIDAELIYLAIISADTTAEAAKAIMYLRDPQGLAAKAYDVVGDRDVYIVVRPDGIVGAYTFGTKGILNYFSLLGVSI
ncbi:FAD binding domain-containing protein [Mycena crocata]|nr:FAD binding domain-containing protein [Mycena crocata]